MTQCSCNLGDDPIQLLCFHVRPRTRPAQCARGRHVEAMWKWSTAREHNTSKGLPPMLFKQIRPIALWLGTVAQALAIMSLSMAAQAQTGGHEPAHRQQSQATGVQHAGQLVVDHPRPVRATPSIPRPEAALPASSGLAHPPKSAFPQFRTPTWLSEPAGWRWVRTVRGLQRPKTDQARPHQR